MKTEVLAKYFDHTILNPAATNKEVLQICNEALEYGFFSVCVNPVNVKPAREHLSGSDIKVCSVVGFPLGASTAEIKARETVRAIADGADEIDMVINIGALKDNNLEKVEKDIKDLIPF